MSYYLGIDLTDQYAMISHYELNNEEPVTVSTVVGSEAYQIPLALAKKPNIGQWYFGDDAKRLSRAGEMLFVESLLKRAIAREDIKVEDEYYRAEDLLSVFLRKLMQVAQRLGNPVNVDKVVITLPYISKEIVTLFQDITVKLGLNANQLRVIDHKECFYYYALSQKPEFWLHDVFLFDANEESLVSYGLKRNLHTVPQLITIEEKKFQPITYDHDVRFQEILEEAFVNKIVSTCYLTGDGFDGNWLHSSLNYLCRGRRAFLGKNLFSKGAAYAAAIFDEAVEWPFVFLGEHEMKFNLSLKVLKQGKHTFYDLVTAGENWFEAENSCDIILGADQEISFWKQLPNSNEAKVESLELTDLPERPEKTTRLRIIARPVSDTKVEIEIKDLGFGEFFKSSGKVWKYNMSI